jgi:hypothetical protein
VSTNVKKIEDIKKLLRHVPEEHSRFYNKNVPWKNTENDDSDVHDSYLNMIKKYIFENVVNI